jgi:WD40 repeat protein
MTYSNNSNLLLAVHYYGYNSKINVINTLSNTVVKEFLLHKNNIINNPYFYNNNNNIINADESSKILFWELNLGNSNINACNLVDSINIFNGSIQSIAWSPFGDKFAVTYENQKNIQMWDINTNTIAGWH